MEQVVTWLEEDAELVPAPTSERGSDGSDGSDVTTQAHPPTPNTYDGDRLIFGIIKGLETLLKDFNSSAAETMDAWESGRAAGVEACLELVRTAAGHAGAGGESEAGK